MNLLIKNGLVCNAFEEPAIRDLLVEDGKISKIAENIEETENSETIDASGNMVLPGFIDMHCNIYDPGYEHREDILSVSKAAAKGGFTSITCQPTTKPVIDNKTVVKYVINNSKKFSSVNIYPYGSMTVDGKGENMSEIGEMKESGIVAISDGGECIQDSYLMRNILLYSGMFDIPVITMCDDKRLTRNGVMNRGKMSTQIGLQGIPRESEEVMVSRNLILSEYNGCRLHITHVSTEGSVNLINAAKKKGVKVTCETSPHYFTLSEDIVESFNTLGKVLPPLRCEKDIEAIKKGLIDGVIDTISSGHTPSTIESKKVEFDKATFGISSLETAFYITYNSLVRENLLTMNQLVEKMSYIPANILGLKDKGHLKQGMDADIVIFDKNVKHTINAQNFASKAKYSLYDGLEVHGEIAYTIVNGNVIYSKL